MIVAGMRRRNFLKLSTALAPVLAAAHDLHAPEESTIESAGSITDLGGIRVGHFTDSRRPTGCTVILFDRPAVAGVDVRGAAPGTRETDLLQPVNTVQQVNAILLSGGSAFGLDAATGVMRFLDEHGIGFHVGPIIVPIVPAAILFDLNIGDPKIRPDARAGYAACEAASSSKVAEGNVGAGTGATVGKLFGMKSAMKSGIGTARVQIGNSGLAVAAIVAVNAVGDVFDRTTGKILAGARTVDGNALSQYYRADHERRRKPRSVRSAHYHRSGGDERNSHEDRSDEGGADGARRARPHHQPRAHGFGWRHNICRGNSAPMKGSRT